jgi:hypothetical protein
MEIPWNGEAASRSMENSEISSFQGVSEANLHTFLPRFSLRKFDRLWKPLGMAKLPNGLEQSQLQLFDLISHHSSVLFAPPVPPSLDIKI